MITEQDWNSLKEIKDKENINYYAWIVIEDLMDHGYDITNDRINFIQETFYKFFKEIKNE